MTIFPKLLLLLLMASGVCLSQASSAFIEYYWIDENELFLWEPGDSPAGILVQKNAQGKWASPEREDWVETVRKIELFKTSSDPWQEALEKLSKERPVSGWARLHKPDVEIVFRTNTTDTPAAGTITFISRIAQREASNTVALKAGAWQKTGDVPLRELLNIAADQEASTILMASALSVNRPAYWDQYLKGEVLNHAPRLSSYIDRDGKQRSLLEYATTEAAWLSRYDAIGCPSAAETKPEEPEKIGNQTGLSSWFWGGTGLLMFALGVFLAQPIHNLIDRWRHEKQREQSGAVRSVAATAGAFRPSVSRPALQSLDLERTPHGSEIDEAIEAAWQESRGVFGIAIRRALGRTPGQATPTLQINSSDSPDWEPAVRELYSRAGKIPENSKLHLLRPGQRKGREWLEQLPGALEHTVESVRRLQEEIQTAERGLITYKEREKLWIDERNSLRTQCAQLADESKALNNNLQKMEGNFEMERKTTKGIKSELKTKTERIAKLEKEQQDLEGKLKSARQQAAENAAAGNRLKALNEDFGRIDGIARRLQEGHQQYYSAKGDLNTTAMISFLANHSLYKLAVASVTENLPLRQNMLINLIRLATELQDYPGFGLATKALHSQFPGVVQPDQVLNASDRLEGSIFQFTLGSLRNSQRINLAPFYLDVDDRGKPYRAD